MRYLISGVGLLVLAMTAPVFAEAQPRSVTVSASHKLELAPTEAEVTLSFQHEANNPEAVDSILKERVEAIKTALAEAGQKMLAISTTNLRVNTRTRSERVYTPDGKYENMPITTYTLSGQHNVKISATPEMETLSRVLLVDGITQVSRMSYRAALPSDGGKAARKSALSEAEKQAREIARSFGLKLGKPSRISVSDNARQTVISSPNLENLTFISTANVTFDLIE